MTLLEAARKLRVHPCVALAELAELAKGQAFEELYPDVPDDYVEAIVASKAARKLDRTPRPEDDGGAVQVKDSHVQAVMKLGAERLVAAMHHKKYYETHKIPEERIVRQYMEGMTSHERSVALRELVRVGILHKHGEGSSCAYSLNKKQKTLIERISNLCQQSPQRGTT